MTKKTEAYVDTSALIAFADRSDSFHALFKRLFSEGPPLITTAMVVAEGHAWFLKRFDRMRALQFIAMIVVDPMRAGCVGFQVVRALIRFLCAAESGLSPCK